MDKCVICEIETLKYKCPKCFARYCSVSCCKSHKEKCSESPAENAVPPPQTTPATASNKTQVPNYPLWSAEVEKNGFPKEDQGDDTVPLPRLELLRDSKHISKLLENPHLRAMCENLVNSENPSLGMAKAMQEPIFTELGDECLKIVDRDNPNLEPERPLLDIL